MYTLVTEKAMLNFILNFLKVFVGGVGQVRNRNCGPNPRRKDEETNLPRSTRSKHSSGITKQANSTKRQETEEGRRNV